MHLCYNGVIMAQGQGACEVPFFEGEPWEAKISKVVLHPVSIFAFVFLLRLTLPPPFRHAATAVRLAWWPHMTRLAAASTSCFWTASVRTRLKHAASTRRWKMRKPVSCFYSPNPWCCFPPTHFALKIVPIGLFSQSLHSRWSTSQLILHLTAQVLLYFHWFKKWSACYLLSSHKNVKWTSSLMFFFFVFIFVSADLPCSHFCIDNSTCGCFKGFQLQNDGVNCEGKQNILKLCF